MNVRVDVPVPCAARVMLVGLSVRLGPLGELAAESVTVPVKLLILAKVRVLLDLEPSADARLDGFAVIVKSGGWLLKNSVIGLEFASLVVKLAKFQLVSIVFVKE